jgi:hypothetical protein
VCGSKEVDIGLIPLSGLVFVLAQRVVMVVVPMLESRLVDDGLLQGSVRPTEPSQRRDGLGKYYEQSQHVCGHSPQWAGIVVDVDMEGPS